MDYLPVCLKLQGEPVLLVGGGQRATRKAHLLQRAGSVLTVVSPEISAELTALVKESGGRWLKATYHKDHLCEQRLVVAATNQSDVNRRVSTDAIEMHLPVNVVDAPELCSFIFPAIIDRNPLLVAVSSSGSSPVLARRVRSRIEALLPASYGQLARFAGRVRDRVRAAIMDESARRLFWEEIIDGSIAEDVLAGRESQAEGALHARLVDQNAAPTKQRGDVALVGAGPGDPDLLTFRAARLLQRADVVLYDRLVSSGVLELMRRDAERIYVGKRRAEHTLPQPQINQLLVDLATTGKRVVRLKGGDPFVFGRGGEEIELLVKQQIPFQVVPGVTAATGAACYAGIPLTHRDHAQSVRFVAAYLQGDVVSHDWSDFQNVSETLVFYMGLRALPEICRQLQAHGRAATTPIALVERGTLANQRVLTGTLTTMPDIVAKAQPHGPTIIIVGEVVTLHRRLSWYDGTS